jgi:hypothetical protein
MPAAAATLRRIHRAVPRNSASPPKTAVQTRRSIRCPESAPALLTLTRSLMTAAAGSTAATISVTL